jgi:two-component system response regulator AtoC
MSAEQQSFGGISSPGQALPNDSDLSPALRDFARLAGRSDVPVLLTGETGTGKTHLARAIHAAGLRARQPFVRVNCGAIPDTLFERELFGHVAGAFTDARSSSPGLIESAHRGTLFLDEVGEMPLQVQSKLLSILEDGVFRRLGSPSERRVDIRVIAATNAELHAMMKQKTFRPDLFHRLSVLRLRVPALRDRRDEIPALVAGMLRRMSQGCAAGSVSAPAMEALCRYGWPGNLRELENALRYAAVFAQGGTLEPHCLPEEVRAAASAEPGGKAPAAGAVRYEAPRDALLEKQAIVDELCIANGNRTHAARALGMSRSALWAKLQRYGLAALNCEDLHAMRMKMGPQGGRVDGV